MTTHKCAATIPLSLAMCSPWVPAPVTGGCTGSGVCFRAAVPTGCLSAGAGARDGAGMHGPTGSGTGLGQCGVTEKQSPRWSPIVQYLQLRFDKHIQLTRVGSDVERGDGGTATAADGAAQGAQRSAVPFRHGSAPRRMVRLTCVSIPDVSRATLAGGCWRWAEHPAFVWHSNQAAQVHLHLHCCPVQLAAGPWTSPSSVGIFLECYQKPQMAYYTSFYVFAG